MAAMAVMEMTGGVAVMVVLAVVVLGVMMVLVLV